MPIGSTYTPLEVYTIVKNIDESHGGNNVGGRIKATAIILRESGGNAKAFRPASQNKYGGDDRGWWQFNSKFYANIPDAVAYDPGASTQNAYSITNGFKLGKENWQPWNGKPIEPETAALAVNAAKAAGEDINQDDNWFDTLAGAAADTTQTVENALTPAWLTSLANLLDKLLDPTWWKRLGIGVLGVGILIVAFIIVFGKDVVEEVKPL